MLKFERTADPNSRRVLDQFGQYIGDIVTYDRRSIGGSYQIRFKQARNVLSGDSYLGQSIYEMERIISEMKKIRQELQRPVP